MHQYVKYLGIIVEFEVNKYLLFREHVKVF